MPKTVACKPNPASLPRLAGLFNFRSLEGRAGCGRRLPGGLLFRSDDLHSATAEDLAALAALHLRTVVDFRDPGEKAAAPDRLPPGVNYVELPVAVGNILTFDETVGDAEARRQMIAVNRAFALEFSEVFGAFMAIAADPAARPLLFHCSAGKDRTGFAAAMLLAALGMEKAVIMADYRRSSTFIRPKYEAFLRRYPALTPLVESRDEYLHAAFAAIEEAFGSTANYLKHRLKVDAASLRDALLE